MELSAIKSSKKITRSFHQPWITITGKSNRILRVDQEMKQRGKRNALLLGLKQTLIKRNIVESVNDVLLPPMSSAMIRSLGKLYSWIIGWQLYLLSLYAANNLLLFLLMYSQYERITLVFWSRQILLNYFLRVEWHSGARTLEILAGSGS